MYPKRGELIYHVFVLIFFADGKNIFLFRYDKKEVEL